MLAQEPQEVLHIKVITIHNSFFTKNRIDLWSATVVWYKYNLRWHHNKVLLGKRIRHGAYSVCSGKYFCSSCVNITCYVLLIIFFSSYKYAELPLMKCSLCNDCTTLVMQHVGFQNNCKNVHFFSFSNNIWVLVFSGFFFNFKKAVLIKMSE